MENKESYTKMEQRLKSYYDQMEIPSDLDEVIVSAANSVKKRKTRNWKRIILLTACFLLSFLFVSNISTIANIFNIYGLENEYSYDYGKSTHEKNGEFQPINETFTLLSGEKITVEGVVTDGLTSLIFIKGEDLSNIFYPIGNEEDVCHVLRDPKRNDAVVIRQYKGKEDGFITLNFSNSYDDKPLLQKDIRISLDKKYQLQRKKDTQFKVWNVNDYQLRINQVMATQIGIYIDYSVTTSDQEKRKKLHALDKHMMSLTTTQISLGVSLSDDQSWVRYKQNTKSGIQIKQVIQPDNYTFNNIPWLFKLKVIDYREFIAVNQYLDESTPPTRISEDVAFVEVEKLENESNSDDYFLHFVGKQNQENTPYRLIFKGENFNSYGHVSKEPMNPLLIDKVESLIGNGEKHRFVAQQWTHYKEKEGFFLKGINIDKTNIFEDVSWYVLLK